MKTTQTNWKAVNINKAEYVGIIEVNESVFTIVKADNKLVFGGACNTGLLQSGYMPIDDFFSLDENLQGLVEDIEVYYRDGIQHCSDIIVNDRM